MLEQTVIQTLNERIAEGFVRMGGKRLPGGGPERAFNAQWSPTLANSSQGVSLASQGINVVAEILAAIAQECEAETGCAVLQQARGAGFTSGLSAERVLEVADAYGEICTIIMSPDAATSFQVYASADTKRTRPKKEFLLPALGMMHFGRLGAHLLCVDMYANAMTPIIVAAPGWVGYRLERGFWVTSGIDPTTQNEVQRFNTDLETDIDATRTTLVETGPTIFERHM